MLLLQLLDFHAGVAGDTVLKFLNDKGLRERAGRVEIVNTDGQLERVYFRLPKHSLYLTQQSKDQLLWGVDRDTPGEQIQQFLDAVHGLRLEMRHEQWLSETRMLRLLIKVRPRTAYRDSLLSTHCLLLTTYYLLLTTHYLLLTTHYSPLATRHPPLTTHYSLLSLLITHYSLLTTHYSLLTTYHLPLTTYRPFRCRPSS